MVIYLNPGADTKAVRSQLVGLGLWTTVMTGSNGQTALTVEPHSSEVDPKQLLSIDGVADVLAPKTAHPRLDQQKHQRFTIAGAEFNNSNAGVLMAGPCSVESRDQILRAAEMVADAGGKFLRGGAFKPRTSPYSFSGHGQAALEWMKEAADACELGVITEVMSELEVETLAPYADILQIGTRNMQNFALLKAVGQANKPVLLKRGMSARVEEWLLAGEHLLANGATQVIFCERGIVGFDRPFRNFLDLAAVALIKHVYGLPIVVDPSHACGRRDLILPLAKAAIAAGADGLLIETHPNACNALSDGPQALSQAELREVGQIFGTRTSDQIDQQPEREPVFNKV